MVFKLPKLKNVVIVVFLMLLSLGVGYGIGNKGFEVNYSKGGKVTISRVSPVPDLNFSLFWKVWDTLSLSYYDKSKLVPSKMVYGAIQGMVASLEDPYTVFLPPSQNKLTNEDLSGNFSGVGIELGYKNSQLAVVSPLPGGPADKAGVKPGDFIVGIKDEAKKLDVTTDGLTLAQAVEDIRGPVGSKVTLTLLREGNNKPITVDLTRETINVPSLKIEMVGSNKDIVHISILKFGGETLSEWKNTVKQVVSQGVSGKIILDLRNNPGGYLQDAVDIAGEFLPKASVVVVQQNGDGSKRELRTDRDGEFGDSKVVVLVNGGSASASEILAGALRDDKGIKLVGDKTFGKGTIQQPEDLDNGAGIHITIAKWLTPNGTWVHGKGLEPNIKIARSDSTDFDNQLQEAIKVIEGR